MSDTEAKILIRNVANLAFLNGTHEHEYLSDKKIKADSERQYNAEKELEEYIEQLQQSNERMKGALEFYQANVSDCNRFGDVGNKARDRLAKDNGKRAQEALEGVE